MDFTLFIFLLFIDVILISLASKTKIFFNIVFSIRTIMPQIIMAFIIFAPLFALSLLITICNGIPLLPVEPGIVNVVNENNNELIKWISSINCFPFVLFIFFIMLQWEQNKKTLPDKKEEINTKKTEIEIKKLNISIIFNYLALTILVIFIIIDIFYTKNNFPTRLIQFINKLDFEEITKYLEKTIFMVLIFIFCLLFYIGIFILPKHFIGEIIKHDNSLSNKRKYKFLIFLPLINIYIVYIINKKILKDGAHA